MYADAVAENPRTGIGRRIIPEEPMAMVGRIEMKGAEMCALTLRWRRLSICIWYASLLSPLALRFVGQY